MGRDIATLGVTQKEDQQAKWYLKTVGHDTLPLNELKSLPEFKVGHLNVCNLTYQIYHLRTYLLGSGFDVCAASETWENSKNDNRLTTMQSYKFL